jgi:3-methyladenine DNA glycosylase AlkD
VTAALPVLTAEELLQRLESNANPDNVAGMARYGINVQRALGVSMPFLRAAAREAGKSHRVALRLWQSGIHEARILATLVEDPARIGPRQMERWARDFDSWDVCDQACQNLLWRAPGAFERAARWSRAKPEFVRRAGFTLMAQLAVKVKDEPDSRFESFLPLIAEAARDERRMVLKGASWALRQIGKRNPPLRAKAIGAAKAIGMRDSRPARWLARDVLRELEGC